MKRKNIIAFSVALMAIGAFTSCSDEFLQDKKNYDYVDASTYNTFSGAKARVDDIYAWCLPNASSEPSWKYNSTGAADLQSKSTEEYSLSRHYYLQPSHSVCFSFHSHLKPEDLLLTIY